jgi:glycosyltransferase involved in cell wall biosynthesis
MGNSFVEAMAAGVPVIATQEGGIADFLFDPKKNPEVPSTGWAVDVNSPKQIAEAVEDILLGGEKKDRILETAKKLVISKYDWDIIAHDMREKIFSRI